MTATLGLAQVAGVVLLMAAGELVLRRTQLPTPVRLASLVPGAVVMLGITDAPARAGWHAVLFVAVVVVVVVPVAGFDQRCAPGITPALLAACAGGVYACVPETDHVLVLVAGLLALVPLTAALRLPLGPGGVAVLVGLLAWAGLTGGTYRHGAVVGAAAVLVLAATEPAARVLAAGVRALPGPWVPGRFRSAAVVGVHTVACLAVSRSAGLQSAVVPAVAVAVPLVALTVLAHAVAVVPWRHRRPSGPVTRPSPAPPMGAPS